MSRLPASASPRCRCNDSAAGSRSIHASEKYPVPNGRDIFMKPYASGFLFTVSYSSPVLRLKSQNDNPRPHGRAQEAFDYFHQPERTAMTECKHIRFANSKSAYCSTSLIFSGERFRFGIAFIRITGLPENGRHGRLLATSIGDSYILPCRCEVSGNCPFRQ